MRRKSFKMLLLMTLVAMLASILAGCGTVAPAESSPAAPASSVAATTEAAASSEAASTEAVASEPAMEELKPVELEFFMVGDGPKDLQIIQDKLNEMSKRDLNCTVKYNFTTWTDFTTKYNLLLSTGQPVDLIYTAGWLDYQKLARNGAFLALDDLLPKYAPEVWAFVPQDVYNQVKIGGKIYTIPATWKEFINNGFQYRQDLQEKYGLPVPDSLANVEAYLEGVKKNEPGQVLTNETVNTGNFSALFSATSVLEFKYGWANGSLYGLVSDYTKPSEMRPYWGTPEFVEDMKMFKTWADKGFWSRSALSAKNDPTSFPNGKAVVIMAGQNPNKYGKDFEIVLGAHPDWKVGYIPYANANGVAVPAHATQNGYGVPVSSKNPERALMFYQKLLLDKEYHDLSQYGILGTHYNEVDGYYEGIGDPSKTGFGREGMNGWAWRNPEYMLFPKSFDVVKQVFADLDVIANKQPDYKGINIGGGFAEDYTSYQSERAALGTVLTQYLAPLEAGLVKDVDAAVKTLMEKANAAGLEKIQAEYQRQWTEYCATYGYK